MQPDVQKAGKFVPSALSFRFAGTRKRRLPNPSPMTPSSPMPSLRSRCLPPLVALACTLACGPAGQAADWPAWRGPDRNGITPETQWTSTWPTEGPTKAWTAKVGVGFSSMVVAEGRLFTLGWADGKDTVTCLDAATGKPVWTHAYDEKLGDKMYEGGPNATPLVSGQRVFTISKTGHAFAFNAATGKVEWETELKQKIGAALSDWGVSGSPVLADPQTLLLSYGPGGTALNAATGEVLWQSGTKKDMTYAAPVLTRLGEKPAAFFFMSEELVAVDPTNGQRLWTSKFGQGFRTHCSDPVVFGDRVFISSGDDGGELLKVSAQSAERVWKNRNLSTFTGSAVLIQGQLYGHETAKYKGAEQELRCVDFETGEIRWGQKGFGQGSIIAAGDRLIVLSDQGELSVVKATPDRFELLARTQAVGGKCWTTPILAQGRIYVRNSKGELVCLDVRSKS
jgi:outer membrane protein assembly factor BamB